MVKVRALSKGYVGGMIREQGEVFDWPEGNKVGSWVKPVAFGGKGDHDGDGLTGGSNPKDDETDADDDNDGDGNGKGKKRGKKPKTVMAKTAEPFADAPEPEVIKGNGVQEALGKPAPDWFPPEDDGAPVAVDE